jgi:hypothetical protein
MNERDEKLRGAVLDNLTRAKVDARNLAVEVVDGHVLVKGTVPTDEHRARLNDVLRQCLDGNTPLDCEVGLREVAGPDTSDGRGRSPLTGTSADSAHESRHQLDRD